MSETVSHHMLRRTARSKRKRLLILQNDALGNGAAAVAAQDRLHQLQVRVSDRIVVARARRGPWLYRVERIPAGD